MDKVDAVSIVEDFWKSVWQEQNVEAIDRFVVEDFVITSDGVDIKSREKFKEWVGQFLERINDFNFEVIETFQNESGTRVASRWKVTGRNNGILGSVKDQSPISFTGTAVWALNEEGKLLHNWVERSTLALAKALRYSD
ncbi:MAG TPA: nuclear transport factor 2 family protein [Anaerovoracaceae bacterium]|nr:nuclear transport factor 2 family protein [Anaerovoracaceae bacterium]